MRPLSPPKDQPIHDYPKFNQNEYFDRQRKLAKMMNRTYYNPDVRDPNISSKFLFKYNDIY